MRTAATAVPPVRPRVVVSGLSSDSHTWNLIYVELLVAEIGCEVRNLGACVPVGLLLDACRRHAPDLVVLSSVNGHGYRDGLAAVTALRTDPLTARLPAVIGGKLGTAGREPVRDAELAAAGFDAVFGDDREACRDLRAVVRDLVGPARPGATELAS